MTESSKHDRQIIPVVEEQAVVLKLKKLTEGVRVRTVVHEAEKVIDEPLATEDIEVERTKRPAFRRQLPGYGPSRFDGRSPVPRAASSLERQLT